MPGISTSFGSSLGGGLLRPLSHRFVEERGDVLLPVSVCGREDHDAVFDGERVQVVDHHVIRLGQKSRLAR